MSLIVKETVSLHDQIKNQERVVFRVAIEQPTWLMLLKMEKKVVGVVEKKFDKHCCVKHKCKSP